MKPKKVLFPMMTAREVRAHKLKTYLRKLTVKQFIIMTAR